MQVPGFCQCIFCNVYVPRFAKHSRIFRSSREAFASDPKRLYNALVYRTNQERILRPKERLIPLIRSLCDDDTPKPSAGDDIDLDTNKRQACGGSLAIDVEGLVIQYID